MTSARLPLPQHPKQTTTPVYALTYIEVLEISRSHLYEVLEGYPEELAAVRREILRMVALRGIVHATKLLLRHQNEHEGSRRLQGVVELAPS